MWGDGECECGALPRMYKVHDEITFVIPRNPNWDPTELEALMRPNDPKWFQTVIWGDWDPPTDEEMFLRGMSPKPLIARQKTSSELSNILRPCPHPENQLAYAGGGMVACGVCGFIVGLK